MGDKFALGLIDRHGIGIRNYGRAYNPVRVENELWRS